MPESNFFLNAFEKAARSVSGLNADGGYRDSVKNAMHHNVIGFYEPYENCGQTTTIVNVAAVLAAKGYTVCVVDLNVEKPDVYRYLRDESSRSRRKYREQTIRDKLLNNAKPAVEVANPSRLKNVWYVSSRFDEHPVNYVGGDDTEQQAERIRDSLLTLFSELSVIYDIVLLDIPSRILDVFCIAGLTGADLIYTFHDGTIRTTELMLKNERVLAPLGLQDVFCNIVQCRIASPNAKILSDDFKLVNPRATLIMTIPYVESVAVVGQGSNIFMYASREMTKLPTTVRTKYRQLADMVIEVSRTGVSNVVSFDSERTEDISVVGSNIGMEVCEFEPLDPNAAQKARENAEKEANELTARMEQRVRQADADAKEKENARKRHLEAAEAQERSEREMRRKELEKQLAAAERRNAEREEREREAERVRRAKAAARGIKLEDEAEYEDEGLIRTPKLVYSGGKIVVVEGEEAEE